MDIHAAYYVGTHWASFRRGEPAEIVGVRIVVPDEGTGPRPCFELRWPDGRIDFAPIGDAGAYRIGTREDLVGGEPARAGA